jgi:hypothetical protein
MGPEFYRARAAEAMRKARADLYNSQIYREIACCYERLAAGSNEVSNSNSAGGNVRNIDPRRGPTPRGLSMKGL